MTKIGNKTFYLKNFHPMISEEGNLRLSSAPTELGVEELSDGTLKGLTAVSSGIIEKLDLNSTSEIKLRRNTKNMKSQGVSPKPKELAKIINRFCGRINEIVGLNRSTPSISIKTNQEVLQRLLYANVITAMETFLSDYLITSVKINRQIFTKLVKGSKDLANRKLSLEEIFVDELSASNIVFETLEKVTFHNLKAAQSYYLAAFSVDINPPEAIQKAVETRHDIIHRSGIRLGEEHAVRICQTQTLKLILEVQEFLLSILIKLKSLQ